MKNKELVKEWIELAESDFELARKGKLSKKVRYETLCFHAQQAAEKAIKAVLVFHNKPFPRTHSIEHLLKILKQEKMVVPRIVEKAQSLTDYAVTARYPEFEKIDKNEYKASLVLAEKTLKWAKLTIEKKVDNLF
jgi:HEPN domain-containing protein